MVRVESGELSTMEYEYRVGHWTGRAGLLFTRLSASPLLAIRMMASAEFDFNNVIAQQYRMKRCMNNEYDTGY